MTNNALYQAWMSELEALRAENEQLRVALRQLLVEYRYQVKYHYTLGGDGRAFRDGLRQGKGYQQARQVLIGSSHER